MAEVAPDLRLNMSIGSSRQWPQYPTATAGTRAVNAGMVVVASFGNSGSTGLYSGDYVMKLSIQKALGDDEDPAHWETWTSPVITIHRP